MKLAYLDWNIFESLRRGELPELAEAIIGWKAREGGVTPFRAHHLAEVYRGMREVMGSVVKSCITWRKGAGPSQCWGKNGVDGVPPGFRRSSA
jgi:hypothetical protein